MIQACDKCQDEDKASWLQTLALRSINSIAKDNNHSIEQEYIGQIICHSRQNLVYDNTEDAECHIVKDTNVGVVISH